MFKRPASCRLFLAAIEVRRTSTKRLCRFTHADMGNFFGGRQPLDAVFQLKGAALCHHRALGHTGDRASGSCIFGCLSCIVHPNTGTKVFGYTTIQAVIRALKQVHQPVFFFSTHGCLDSIFVNCLQGHFLQQPACCFNFIRILYSRSDDRSYILPQKQWFARIRDRDPISGCDIFFYH